MRRPWTKAEIRLLGTKSDFVIGRKIGRPGKAVWAKRTALKIAAPPPLVRRWIKKEDRIALSKPPSEAAGMLNRTIEAIKIRRHKLSASLNRVRRVKLLSLEEAKSKIQVPRYESRAQEEKVRFVSGPYNPPHVPVNGWMNCKLRGMLQVGGYTNAMIPWPVAVGHPKQLIICEDLLKALRIESRVAVCYHFGISPQSVSTYRRKLGDGAQLN